MCPLLRKSEEIRANVSRLSGDAEDGDEDDGGSDQEEKSKAVTCIGESGRRLLILAVLLPLLPSLPAYQKAFASVSPAIWQPLGSHFDLVRRVSGLGKNKISETPATIALQPLSLLFDPQSLPIPKENTFLPKYEHAQITALVLPRPGSPVFPNSQHQALAMSGIRLTHILKSCSPRPGSN